MPHSMRVCYKMDVPRFASIQWEDRFMSVISFEDITSENKQPSEGEIIKATFGKQKKKYEAVVCEIHPNQKYLYGRSKLPPKHCYDEAKQKDVSNKTTQEKENPKKLLLSYRGDEHTAMEIQEGNPIKLLPSKCNESKEISYEQKSTEVPENPTKLLSSNLDEGDKIHIVPEQKSDEISKDSEVELYLKQHGSETPRKRRITKLEDEMKNPKENVKYLSRRLRKMEERKCSQTSNKTAATETASSSDSMPEVQQRTKTQDFYQSVGHVKDNNKKFQMLCSHVFTFNELKTHSPTGKRTVKCVDTVRPALEQEKLKNLYDMALEYCNLDCKEAHKKLENFQKVLRRNSKNE